MASVTHIANKARSQASMMFGMTTYLKDFCNFSDTNALIEAEKALQVVAPNEWTSLGAITGNTGQVAAAIREIKQRMKKIARVSVITDGLLDVGYAVMHNLRFFSFARANAAAISAIKPLHALALGVPTDVAINNLLWKYARCDLKATQLDQSSCGLIFISPALPSTGDVVVSLIDGMNKIAEAFNHKLYITVNIETVNSLVAVINILFDRSKRDEVDNAHRCADALLNYIHTTGLEIYRARSDMMENIVSRDYSYWNTIRSLKKTFDPDNIISPGRYNIKL